MRFMIYRDAKYQPVMYVAYETTNTEIKYGVAINRTKDSFNRPEAQKVSSTRLHRRPVVINCQNNPNNMEISEIRDLIGRDVHSKEYLFQYEKNNVIHNFVIPNRVRSCLLRNPQNPNKAAVAIEEEVVRVEV